MGSRFRVVGGSGFAAATGPVPEPKARKAVGALVRRSI